jgi:hypothetical protein
MVAEVIEVFIDALVGLVEAMATTILSVFDTLIYNPTDGLTGFATYTLLFAGIGLGIGLFNRISNKKV